MKCYLLTVFVFVLFLTLVKGYNLPFPLGLLVPRTKYDYDLTRFFLGAKEPGPPDVVKDYKDSTQVYQSPIRTTETPIHKDEQCHQNHPIHFGSQFSPYDHRSEVAYHDHFGFNKPFYIKFQHDPPIRPYRPAYEVQSADNIKTGFGSPFPFNQNNYFPTTTAPLLPAVPTVPPAPPAPWIHPTQFPQGSFFGPDTTKQVDNAQVFQRFGENVQQDTTKGYGASFGAFGNSEVDSKKDFQPSYQSFNVNNYKAPTVPATVPTSIYKPVETTTATTTTTTTTKPGKINAALLTSLAGGADFEVKYKETETDYYDFDEADLKRPQYDISSSRKLFEEFVQKYGKTYKDKQDEEVHYQHFVNSLMSVNRLNSEGGSASFDINFMSDEDPKVYGK